MGGCAVSEWNADWSWKQAAPVSTAVLSQSESPVDRVAGQDVGEVGRVQCHSMQLN